MNNSDKEIQEKVGSLDTLSSGIVYGKEDAWEKLQARMDTKPPIRISLKYWVAAAVLLVLITALPVYYHHEKGDMKNMHSETVRTSIPKESGVQKNAVEIPQQITPAIQQISPLKNKSIRQSVIVYKKTEEPVNAQVELPVMPVENKVAAIPVSIVNNAPAPNPKPTMKVVHINDIENGNALQNTNAATVFNNERPPDLRKMQVVHIADVMKQEYEMNTLLRRENRLTFGRNLFNRPDPNADYSAPNTEDDNQSHHLLKNIFNTQN